MRWRVYSYSGCSTCRNALKFLESRKIPIELMAIRETPPGMSELRRGLAACGGAIRRLFNTSGLDYKKLNLKERLPKMSEDEALQLLSKHGNLVKRPFVISGDRVIVGFRPEEWDRFFSR